MNLQIDTTPGIAAPAGMGQEPQYVVLAKTGRAELAYLPQQPPPAPAVQAPPEPTVVVQQSRFDPVTTRIAAASAGIVGTAWVVGEHARQLAEAAHAAEGLGFAAAAVAVGVGVLRGSQPKIDVNVTANIVGASASATSSSDARSVSGWKNRA